MSAVFLIKVPLHCSQPIDTSPCPLIIKDQPGQAGSLLIDHVSPRLTETLQPWLHRFCDCNAVVFCILDASCKWHIKGQVC